MEQFCPACWNEDISPEDYYYERYIHLDGEDCKLEIQRLLLPEFRGAMDKTIMAGEGFLIVSSDCGVFSFDQVEYLYDKIRRIRDLDNSPGPSWMQSRKLGLGRGYPPPVTIVATSCAYTNFAFDERQVTCKAVVDLAQRLGCAFVDTTGGRSKHKGKEAVYDMVRMIRDQRNADLLTAVC